MSENNEQPEIQVPDSLEGVLAPRDYRKMSQESLYQALQNMGCGFQTTLGRPGLSDEVKMQMMQHTLDHMESALPLLNDAIKAMRQALDLAASE